MCYDLIQYTVRKSQDYLYVNRKYKGTWQKYNIYLRCENKVNKK